MSLDPAEARVSYPVGEILGRIEGKVDGLAAQLSGKADAAAVHDLDARVRVLERDTASMSAVATATSRSRGAFWLAVGALGSAGGAIVYVLTVLHPRG